MGYKYLMKTTRGAYMAEIKPWNLIQGNACGGKWKTSKLADLLLWEFIFSLKDLLVDKEVFFMTERTQSKWTTRMLTEGALAIALAFVLGRIKVFSLPQGGSITPGEMIPLIIFALRYGAGKGVLVGAVYGLIDMLIGGYVIHPAQAILDYILAFGSMGLAGLFSNEFIREGSFTGAFKGSLVAILGRFICHVISGVVFFASNAPESQGALMYSVVYNGTFLLVEFAIAMIILALLQNVLKKNLPTV